MRLDPWNSFSIEKILYWFFTLLLWLKIYIYASLFGVNHNLFELVLCLSCLTLNNYFLFEINKNYSYEESYSLIDTSSYTKCLEIYKGGRIHCNYLNQKKKKILESRNLRTNINKRNFDNIISQNIVVHFNRFLLWLNFSKLLEKYNKHKQIHCFIIIKIQI